MLLVIKLYFNFNALLDKQRSYSAKIEHNLYRYAHIEQILSFMRMSRCMYVSVIALQVSIVSK